VRAETLAHLDRYVAQFADNVERVLGIELLLAAQALEFTVPADLAPTIRSVRDLVRGRIPAADKDREFGLDIQAAREFALSMELGEFLLALH
jgi:histidine ammonia-lyase